MTDQPGKESEQESPPPQYQSLSRPAEYKIPDGFKEAPLVDPDIVRSSDPPIDTSSLEEEPST